MGVWSLSMVEDRDHSTERQDALMGSRYHQGKAHHMAVWAARATCNHPV